jgi:hypothetical protein
MYRVDGCRLIHRRTAESLRTTKLHARTGDELILDEIERSAT